MNFSGMEDTEHSISFLGEGSQRAGGDVDFSEDSFNFMDLPGTPSRDREDDFNFFQDGTMLPSQSVNMFMTPGTNVSQTPGKRKQVEKMTPSNEEARLFKSSEPVEKKKKHSEVRTPAARAPESPLFAVPGPADIKTPLPLNKFSSSFSTEAPTPMMRSSTPAITNKSEKKISTTKEGSGSGKPGEVEVRMEQQLFTEFPPAATPPAAKRKEEASIKQMNVQAQEVAPPSLNFKEKMEAQRKKLQDSLESLQSLQEQGGDQLLAKAAAVQDEVASYKEKLAVKKETIRAHVNHALLNLLPFKPADK